LAEKIEEEIGGIMYLYPCELTFHENLFYATREVGRLYETGRYLHNYALTYALGLAETSYFHDQQIPSYQTELEPLNQRGVYVMPGRGVSLSYDLVTFKYADNAYRVKMSPGSQNTPSYGRAKEIAVGSRFEFGVLSLELFRLPNWIRMGLWRSKARLKVNEVVKLTLKSTQEQQASYPINPLDTPGQLQVFDLVSMPPSSLLDNPILETEWWYGEVDKQQWWLPAHMQYKF
jgi:CRISPR-associated protein Csc1